MKYYRSHFMWPALSLFISAVISCPAGYAGDVLLLKPVAGDISFDEALIRAMGARTDWKIIRGIFPDTDDRLGVRGMAALARCPELLQIRFSVDSSVDDAALANLARNCPKLEDIELMNFGFTRASGGKITVFPSEATKIADLGLKSLAACKNLKTLRMTVSGEVTDEALAVLSVDCPKLEVLELAKADKITDAGLLAVSTFKSLKGIALPDAAKLTDKGLAALAKSSTLISIDLPESSLFSDEGLKEFSNVERKVFLRLSGSFFPPELVASLKEKDINVSAGADPETKKTTLVIPADCDDAMLAEKMGGRTDWRSITIHAPLRPGWLEKIAACPDLRSLTIDDYASSESPQADYSLIGECRKLESLHLAASGFTPNDDFVAALSSGCPELSYVYIRPKSGRPSNISGKGSALFAKCGKLTSLDISVAPGVDDETVMALLGGRNNWKRIRLRGSGQVTAKGLAALAMPGLTDLLVGCVDEVGDGDLAEFARNSPALRELELNGAKGITDDGFRALAESGKITTISLLDTENITDNGLSALKDNQNITTLRLPASANITDKGIGELSGCSGLLILDLKRAKITAAGLDSLAEAPNLILIYLGTAGQISTADVDDFITRARSRHVQVRIG